MKHCILFSLPGNEQLTAMLSEKLKIESGALDLHDFPDGESYVRIGSDVSHKTVILIAGLEHPNNKILPLMFAAKTVKELGATKICLISPYLPYMRQDKCFKPGEAVTSILFAQLISSWINHLIIMDPHLHRIKDLSEIYSLDSISVLHATKKMAEWISNNVDSPFIIGPDEESRQWVYEVAKSVSAPYAIIKKTRYGDRKVSLSMPETNVKNTEVTPIIVDDVISTGTSMLAVIQQLTVRGFNKPLCMAVHALFNNETHQLLLNAGAKEIITCNTIPHASNQININDLIVDEILRLKLC